MKEMALLFRVKSLQPFSRHFTGQKFLEMLELNETNGETSVNGNFNPIKRKRILSLISFLFCLYRIYAIC